MLLGGWIELVCGFLIAFGFLTRVAAFIAAGEMAVAYFMVHAAGHAIQHVPPTAAESFFPVINKGEPAVLYCWIFLLIFFYGPGIWSIDMLIARKKPNPATT